MSDNEESKIEGREGFEVEEMFEVEMSKVHNKEKEVEKTPYQHKPRDFFITARTSKNPKTGRGTCFGVGCEQCTDFETSFYLFQHLVSALASGTLEELDFNGIDDEGNEMFPFRAEKKEGWRIYQETWGPDEKIGPIRTYLDETNNK